MLQDHPIEWLASLGNFEIHIAIALIFFVSAFLPIPRTILLVGVGATVGLHSLAVIIPSATFGSLLAFVASKRLLRDWVRQRLDRKPWLKILARAVDEEGWPVVALMRFWGPMPSSMQNYLFGLTDINFLPYAVLTTICSLPQIVLYTMLGASSRDLAYAGNSPIHAIFSGAAVATVLAVIILISRRVHRLLAEAARNRPS